MLFVRRSGVQGASGPPVTLRKAFAQSKGFRLSEILGHAKHLAEIHEGGTVAAGSTASRTSRSPVGRALVQPPNFLFQPYAFRVADRGTAVPYSLGWVFFVCPGCEAVSRRLSALSRIG